MKLAFNLWRFLGFPVLSLIIAVITLRATFFSPAFVDQFLDTHKVDDFIIDIVPSVYAEASKQLPSQSQIPPEKVKEGLQSALYNNPLSAPIKKFTDEFLAAVNTPNKSLLDVIFPGTSLKQPVENISKSLLRAQIESMPVCAAGAARDCRPSGASIDSLVDESLKNSSNSKTYENILKDQPLREIVKKSWVGKIDFYKSILDKIFTATTICVFLLLGLYVLTVILIRHDPWNGYKNLGKKFIWFALPNVILLFLSYIFWDEIMAKGQALISERVGSNLNISSPFIDDLFKQSIIVSLYIMGVVLLFGLIQYAVGKTVLHLVNDKRH